jgi:hypothetical protein
MRSCLILFLALGTTLLAQPAAGLKWSAPQGWKAEGARPMRAATYGVPAAPGDHDPAECAVYFFGQGSGGSIQANLDRWKGQFQRAGQPADAKIDKRTVHGLTVTTIETSGDYSGMGGPMAQQASVAHNYRLLGAIVEGPGGNIFVKFTGPAKTVEANRKQFDQLLASFQKE